MLIYISVENNDKYREKITQVLMLMTTTIILLGTMTQKLSQYYLAIFTRK